MRRVSRQTSTFRFIIVLLIFLAGGAIVNVAASWGLAAFAQPMASLWAEGLVGTPRTIPRFANSAHNSHPRCRGTWDVRSGYTTFGFDIYILRTRGAGIGNHFQTTSLVVGWPSSAMWSHYAYYADSINVEPGNPPVFEEEMTGVLMGDKWLPTSVIWPGFAINTIFYAAILWLLFFAPGNVRRSIRRWRGLCEKCAYPVGSSPVCTECGAGVRRPLSQAISSG